MIQVPNIFFSLMTNKCQSIIGSIAPCQYNTAAWWLIAKSIIADGHMRCVVWEVTPVSAQSIFERGLLHTFTIQKVHNQMVSYIYKHDTMEKTKKKTHYMICHGSYRLASNFRLMLLISSHMALFTRDGKAGDLFPCMLVLSYKAPLWWRYLSLKGWHWMRWVTKTQGQ